MMSVRPSWAHVLLAAPWFGEAMAGYLSVQMSPAQQCNSSVVTWSGDDGPYHLLLTPTDFNQHGYNVWIPEIPATLSNYTIPINQPAGASFLLTMWGKSGINYAGTSDVMTVGPSNITSCFLTDSQILSLYSFSFNITDTYNGYPPQCGNLTMTWPTSLESNVTSGTRRRSELDIASDWLQAEDEMEEFESYEERDESSSTNSGNTTYPPTLFGIIPLGNAFQIPITYGYNTPIAQNLPNTSLSNNPTTWTSKGVTSLNWTVEMAKGTRFILVAGIGSEKQWANGGSSRMLTVGQGDTSCVGVTPEDPNPPPSITGTSTASATASPPPSQGAPNRTSSSTKVVIGCVVSVVATLIIVGVFLFCRRRIRRRRETAYIAEPYSPGKSTARLGATSPLDTRLDLINGGRASRQGQGQGRSLSRIQTTEPASPTGSNPFLDSPNRVSASDRDRGYVLAERTLSTDDTWSTPVSPTRDSRNGSGTASSGFGIPGVGQPGYPDELMNRSASRDQLLRGSNTSPSPFSPIDSVGAGAGGAPWTQGQRTGPLQVQNRSHPSSRLSVDDGFGIPDGENAEDDEDITTLKRDTLANFGRPGTSRAPGARRPARRRTEEEPEYVVHRDAGRVNPVQQPVEERRVLELPPRYEELQWEDGERERHAAQQQQ